MVQGFYYSTIFGRIGIAETDSAISHLFFANTVKPAAFVEVETPLLRQAAVELEEYFSGKRFSFELPLNPPGTYFQQKVWKELLRIPYGQTKTYQQIAKAIGNIKACRAVGMANHLNPIPIFIPCHRVIGAGGEIKGYAGGLAFKEALLRLEREGTYV
ncbi:MAG: methylated-DNA--[protein]-cysteine S-methyltransferase [Bacteroidales bacterium]